MFARLRRRPVLGWVFYDWANSAFATTVMAGFFPVFFKQYWSAGADPTVSTFRLGVGNGVASLVIALLAPLLGAMADRGGTRIRLLALFTVLGAASTAAMYWAGKGDWPLAILLYSGASLGFAGGIAFYDSLLLDVAKDEAEIDLVSAYGYSAGYLGGGLLFAVNVAMTLKPALFGLSDAAQAVRLSFVMVALWWIVFAIPVLVFVREQKPSVPVGPIAGMKAGWTELFTTLKSLRQYKTIALFLAAYWLYIDGVNTVIKMAVDYGLSLGFEASSLIVALLITQFVGFPAAIAFGWLGKRFGPKGAIQSAIFVYFCITIWAYWLDNVREFYAMAIAIGLVQGGVQSLSRSLYGRLVPPHKAGEFFGFFNMMGKFAAVIGPLLTGMVALATGSSRLAILSLVILFALGSLLLHRVRLAPAGESSGRREGGAVRIVSNDGEVYADLYLTARDAEDPEWINYKWEVGLTVGDHTAGLSGTDETPLVLDAGTEPEVPKIVTGIRGVLEHGGSFEFEPIDDHDFRLRVERRADDLILTLDSRHISFSQVLRWSAGVVVSRADLERFSAGLLAQYQSL